MTLRDLLKQYEATRDELLAKGHPDGAKYAVLVENTKQLIREFETAGFRPSVPRVG